MTRQPLLYAAGAILMLALLVAGITLGLERLVGPPPSSPPAAAQAPSAGDVPHITATLFYAAADGQELVGVRRDVALAESPIEQGRLVLDAQLEEPAPDGYVSAIPAGTRIRAFYLTDRGDAFVDLSAEVATAHPGGSAAELLTVYAIVNAVTANLPAVARVQLLIEGTEADTLVGHVDLRRPLPRDNRLVRAAP